MFTPFTVSGCSLELLRVGEQGIFSYCNLDNPAVIKKLKSLGLTTGTNITVEQEFPSLVIKVGNILLEMDKELARSIYVRILGK